MSINHSNRVKRQFHRIVLMGTICIAAVSAEKIKVPLFLFSGQSNMVGLGASASTADQKKMVPNVKIDCVSDNNKKKWTTLGPGFGADASHFGPEFFFGKILSDSMPDTKFAFIKDAKSGTYLGQSGGWLSPSSGGPGTLYKNMMTHIDNALKSFNDAYDTTQYTPQWAGFVWHQGEFDGMDKSLADKYETNLTNLIKDIREKTGDDSLPIIIPMICGNNWQYKTIIQAAEAAVAKKTVNADTMTTEGLALSDGIHYNGASMEKIGRVCGQKWLAMKYLKSNTSTNEPPVISSASAVTCTTGSTSTYTVTATDPDNDQVTFTVSGQPNWITFASPALTLTPVTGSTNDTVTVIAADGKGGLDTLNLEITIVPSTAVIAAGNAKLQKHTLLFGKSPISLPFAADRLTTVTLYALNGTKVMERTLMAGTGNTLAPISTVGIVPGSYMLRISNPVSSSLHSVCITK